MQPAVQAKGVAKYFGRGSAQVQALVDIDFQVDMGDFVAVMGPSGSGKSTLLSILGCLDSPDQGEVFVSGRGVQRMKEAERAVMRRQHIGFVFQTYNLIPILTAVENVALPLLLDGKSGREATKRAVQVLDEVGLADRRTHRPTELSGGQQQRVAIARALVPRPAIVLADEPTGNLDSHSSHEIMQLLRRASDTHGQTVVLITHDVSVAAWARRVTFLRDGRIAGNVNLGDMPHALCMAAIADRHNELITAGGAAR